MQNLITRIAMLVIAFGFFISCSPSYESVLSSSSDLGAEELMEQAVRLREIDPQDPASYHLEGMSYLRSARSKAPELRENDYRPMRRAFDQALTLYSSTRNGHTERSAINAALESSWSFEHNHAAGLVSNDSVRTNQQLSLAAIHAHNAIIISPDSLISFELLADIYARMGNIDQAIRVLAYADSTLAPKSGRVYESLAYLYYTKGDFEAAVDGYEKALDWNRSQILTSADPSSRELNKGSVLNTWHGLINAYIAARQTDQAISSLEDLIQAWPANSTYKLLLARQLIQRIGTQFENEIQPDRMLIVNTLNRVRDLSAGDPEFKLHNALSISELAGRVVEEILDENDTFSTASNPDIMLLCESALELYKEVLEVDPSNPSAISGIADIYLLIGNEEEASRWYKMLE